MTWLWRAGEKYISGKKGAYCKCSTPCIDANTCSVNVGAIMDRPLGVLLRFPKKSSGLRLSSIFSTAATATRQEPPRGRLLACTPLRRQSLSSLHLPPAALASLPPNGLVTFSPKAKITVLPPSRPAASKCPPDTCILFSSPYRGA